MKIVLICGNEGFLYFVNKVCFVYFEDMSDIDKSQPTWYNIQQWLTKLLIISRNKTVLVDIL